MSTDERLDQIVTLLTERGFMPVKQLSELFQVSEVTIRRDLQRLHDEQRVRRTYGGAISLTPTRGVSDTTAHVQTTPVELEGFLTDRVDVLIATSFDDRSDRILVDRTRQKGIPIIAESLEMSGMTAMVAVDNYQAGLALGRWAGHYARQHFQDQGYVLDLTYHLANTQARSRGFMDGLKEILPLAELTLSVNAQSTWPTAYQLAIDALRVYPHLNIIFAINDATACGAAKACQELGVDPDSMLLMTFGLEGDTLKEALCEGSYCKAGLAMFPEIVGPVCIEAAINAYNRQPMPAHLVTPHSILTAETLPDYYHRDNDSWHLCWETVKAQLTIPLMINAEPRAADALPRRIAFVVPFTEHEWYKNLVAAMQAHTARLGIELEVVDAAQHLKDEVALRKRSIAQLAAEQVRAGDVILIDGGQVTSYLAEELREKKNITVITNSMPVFDLLRDRPNITLISTGGLLRHESQTLIGPTAEAVLRELRVDKLFLAVTGISQDFGLFHPNLAEVTMKQAMIRAAREVILLADHTKFDQDSVIQVASINAVDKLVTDNALPASIRLDLTKLGVEILLAKT